MLGSTVVDVVSPAVSLPEAVVEVAIDVAVAVLESLPAVGVSVDEVSDAPTVVAVDVVGRSVQLASARPTSAVAMATTGRGAGVGRYDGAPQNGHKPSATSI